MTVIAAHRSSKAVEPSPTLPNVRRSFPIELVILGYARVYPVVYNGPEEERSMDRYPSSADDSAPQVRILPWSKLIEYLKLRLLFGGLPGC